MTKNIPDELNLLRSILPSDDHLQVRSFEDHNQVYLKLTSDIEISFCIDSLDTSIKSLTLNNIHDLHISKKGFLKHEQWINIQDYFNQLIQQANSTTSLYSIIQLIQEKQLMSIVKEDTSIQKFRSADLIYNQIVHDPTIDRSNVLIGYEDRSTNIHEISFNDFENIDKDEFGIPADCIRYYKINQQIVWDKIKKLDILTGPNDIQGLHRFDQSSNQWILCSDIQSIDSMCIPERCKFLSWDILHSNERYKEIFQTLKSSLCDIICLQNVTKDFFNLLLNENWLKENNYYILYNNNHQEIISGQLMLMKNFRPKTFSISEYIIARFELNSYVTIDLINIHLHKSHEESAQELENLLKKMNTQNYMIIGDVAFGDYDLIQENILQKYHYHIHDLWKDIYDIDENPGYTFDSNTRLRSTRYLLHKLPNLNYSIEYINLPTQETIPIDSINNQSNHYALQLLLHFQIRSISHHSALVIFPENQCSTFIKLFCPFFDLIDTEDDEENILLPLRFLLAQYQSFEIKNIKNLQKKIKRYFSQCRLNDNDITMEQFDDSNKNSIQYIYILQELSEDDERSFRIASQLPLGSVLEPIGLNQCDYISNDLVEFFSRMNLYHDGKFFEEKQEKFNRLLNYFDEIFNKNTLNYFSYTLHPYGSYRLGLHGDDLDLVFVLSENKSVDNPTSLDKSFLQLKLNPLLLNNYIIDLLETRITKDLNNEIINCRKIDAIYPIISIIFNDQTRVEIFVQIVLNNQDQDNIMFYEPIHGVHDIERLITYVRFPVIFQHLLTFIRTWAQNVGLYGQVYGYLGGYSWAILCAYICHKYFPSLNSNFSLEQFSLLVKNFFLTYSQFNWSYESLCLYSHHSSCDNRGSMRILCPNSPYNNTSRSTINSTRYLIIQSFQDALNKNCEDILRISNEFPDKTIKAIFQLTLSGETLNELNQWIGYMKSRLAHFLDDCENECNLFVQIDSKIEKRKKSLERFYSIGFQVNEQILSRHRDFYYSLNKYLDQFKICSFRTDTMKISYKLMSINQWINERNKSCI